MNVSDHEIPPAINAFQLTSTLNVLLRLGTMMLRSGATAFRVHQSLKRCAMKMGLVDVSIHVDLNAIHVCCNQSSHSQTSLKEVDASGVNAERLSLLKSLVQNFPVDTSPKELAARLDEIEMKPPRYSILQTSSAVGAACGAFAVLNGGIGVEVLAATFGGGAGQYLRSWMLRRRFNQFAVTAISALVASGVYCLLAVLFTYAGFGVPRHTIGFVSSVLFLIPGFPLIAALLDLLQHKTSASISRLAYASMLMLSASLGLSAVIEVVGFSVAAQPVNELSGFMLLGLRILASFIAGSGFAILFNCSASCVVLIGVFSIIGNLVRLTLRDAGCGLPLSTFFGALSVGLAASLACQWIDKPRITLTVPGIIMMVPGLYVFDALVLFNQGEITAAIRCAILFCFGVGAMAMGLAAARFITQPEWLKE